MHGDARENTFRNDITEAQEEIARLKAELVQAQTACQAAYSLLCTMQYEVARNEVSPVNKGMKKVMQLKNYLADRAIGRPLKPVYAFAKRVYRKLKSFRTPQ